MAMHTVHLSTIQGATLIAWHAQQDIQAVRLDGVERLYIRGEKITLPADYHGPVQIVINACGAGMTAGALLAALGVVV